MKIVTAAQMAELESLSNLSEEQLAENAGYRVAAFLDRMGPSSPVVVLCGPGNNGGDGLIAAFYLATEFAIDVEVILAADPENLRPIARKAYRRLAETDVAIHVAGSKKFERRLERLNEDEFVVDCLLGTGQKGPPRGDVATVIDAVGPHPCVVTVDVPTGIDSDTGEVLGPHLEPYLTLVLGAPKRYLFTNQGRMFAESWRLVPIGIKSDGEFEAADLISEDVGWRIPVRRAFSNKRSSTVLSIAGSSQYPGAAALAAMGAARMGAGLVVAASTNEGLAGVRSVAFESPLAVLPSIDGEVSGESDLSRWLEDADTVVIGPGLGRSEGAGLVFEQAAAAGLPMVVDGDALFHLANRKINIDFDTAVLTPHAGEAAKLLGSAADDIDADRFAAATQIMERYGQTVVLKGLHPIIASPEETMQVIPTGSPLLATAGTGDVLAGMIGALMAQGAPPSEAAVLGTYIHGCLAEIISGRIGRRTYGILASDLAQDIPVAVSLLRDGALYPKCLELLRPDQEEEFDEEVP